MSPFQLVAASVAMALGALVQGAVGFGAALIAAPLLVLVDPVYVPGPITVAALLLNVAMLVSRDEGPAEHDIRWAMAGLVPGTIVAGVTLAVLPQHGLSIAVSVLVLLGVGLTASGLAIPRQPTTLFAAGTMSGFMGTISGIGGPPVALVYQNEPAAVLRRTLPRYFLFGGVISAVTLLAVGRLDGHDLLLSLVLLPGLALGLAASVPLTGHVDKRTARPFVLGLSALAAIVVFAREVV
ncbi:MAG: uncharacterized protein QOH64_1418 [Acidimicrobiaceae bacterium]|jgi:uncharacterized membrane protein YfcA